MSHNLSKAQRAVLVALASGARLFRRSSQGTFHLTSRKALVPLATFRGLWPEYVEKSHTTCGEIHYRITGSGRAALAAKGAPS